MRIEEEKERKRLEQFYMDKLAGLFAKMREAKTLDECYEISKERRELVKEIETKTDPELFKELMKESWRLHMVISHRIERLGGHKAPHHRR